MISDKSLSILLKLYEANQEVTKSFLLDAVPNAYSLEKNLELLSSRGLVTVRQEILIRKTYFISLTDKGKYVASQIKKIEDIIKGDVPFDGAISREEGVIADPFEPLSPNFSEKAYDDHAIIEDARSGEKIMIFIKGDEKGIQRLWCENDGSFSCIHAKYSWSLPDVQSMYYKYVRTHSVTS
jgi:predicted transcriptional regulator